MKPQGEFSQLPLQAVEEPVHHHPRSGAEQPLAHLRDQSANLRCAGDVDRDAGRVFSERDRRLPLRKPGRPFPSTANLYDTGGCLSVISTAPSNVPVTAATVALSTTRYRSSPTDSNESHPGRHDEIIFGSIRRSQTRGDGTRERVAGFQFHDVT